MEIVVEKDLLSGPKLQRLGMLMEPEPGNAQEVEGVLNPAAARGPEGELYLFPRLVARGNYSRIGIARVRFNKAGDPAGVERLGIALEPEADYERRPDGGGGCEDPRITFVEPLQSYMMTYTAFSPEGPRIALALSKDLFHWKRLGLATFGPYHGVECGDVDDKDASLFLNKACARMSLGQWRRGVGSLKSAVQCQFLISGISSRCCRMYSWCSNSLRLNKSMASVAAMTQPWNMLQCLDRKVEAAHLVENDHVERRGGRARSI
jgi:hypothetical protein